MTIRPGSRSANKGLLSPCSRCGLVIVVALGAGSLSAAEIKGTLKEVSTRQDTLTLLVDQQERTLPISSEVKVLGLNRLSLKDGLDSKLLQHPGIFLTVQTEQREGRAVIVAITILRRGSSPVRGK